MPRKRARSGGSLRGGLSRLSPDDGRDWAEPGVATRLAPWVRPLRRHDHWARSASQVGRFRPQEKAVRRKRVLVHDEEA